MNLYLKIIDAQSYLTRCRIYEKEENRKIPDYIDLSLVMLKDEIEVKIFKEYYYYPQNIGPRDLNHIDDIINKEYIAFRNILDNFIYLPILHPHFTLHTMTDEISTTRLNRMKASDTYFKIIPEYNFSESMMAPGYRTDLQEALEFEFGSNIPNVLSMTAIYHNNPLMWSLIFHEYGHSVFRSIRTRVEISNIIDNARVFSIDNKLKIPIEKFDAIISEIYSDIFAITYYRSNYFFAFYFHEILNSSEGYLNENHKIDEDSKEHPPSKIRFKYMLKELEQKGYANNDRVLNRIKEIHAPFAQTELEQDNPLDNMYMKIYDDISKFFKDETISIDFNFINELYKNLQNKLPIGTSYREDLNIKEALKRKAEKFDIDRNNRIIDMIYSGWIYLFFDLIDNFYEITDPNQYLIKSDMNQDKGNIENKLLKINKEYSFLMNNISYSIEMSVITSNFRGNNT